MKKLFFLFVVLLITTCSTLAEKKYAVLIVGDLSVRETNIPTSDLWKGDGTGEMDEFWNDTYLMWEMLQSKGFHSDSIFVLFGDGYDRHPEYHRYNPGNVTITDRSATVANVRNLFEDLRYGTNNKPQITEDDFLFVWVFDHGGYYNGHSKIYLYNDGTMLDTVFAKLVNPIPAHRKAFWMQQCYGGGFADDLSAPNTVFISASQPDQSAYVADKLRLLGEYGDFENYTENETYNNTTYHHGEFNYHLISVVNQESPSHQNNYGGEYYVNYDPNGDSIISMQEAFLWDTIHNSRRTSAGVSYPEYEDPVYTDLGNIGCKMSFEYPTLLFDNISNNEIHRGIVGISKDLIVTNGQTLTFTGNSDVTLCDSVTLIIEEGATLVIDGKVSFKGTTNNLLVIHGGFVQREGASLSFSNMQVVSDAAELSVTDAFFENTELKYKPLGSSTIGESSALTGNLTVTKCRFHNPSKPYAIFVEKSRDFFINEDTITACSNNGIYIKNCGNVPPAYNLRRRVRYCSITGCSNAGLVFYASTGNIYTNTIYGNGVGVKLLNRCNILDFKGNCAALDETQTQYIHDNNSYEIYMTSNCHPEVLRYNSIHKTSLGTTPYVCYDNTHVFIDTPNERLNINVSKNEWGNNFSPATHLYSTTLEVGFDYLPYWGFYDCPEWPQPDGRMLSTADSLCDVGDYEMAKTVYHQIIEEFPNSVSAETALKALLPLESFINSDYETLKQYYLTDTVIASQETLLGLSSYLANRCDENLANYDKAIAWYEDIIISPETSFADSIFATIDLGNLYLEMDENGAKAAGRLVQLKPKSKSAFEMQCEHALSLLPRLSENDYPITSLREDPLPYWVDTIVTQPEGYYMDAEGNVEISSSDGLVWLISVVNGLNGCEPDDFEGRTVKLVNDIDFGNEGWNFCFSPIGTRSTPFLGTFDGDGHKIHHLCQRYSRFDTINNYYFDMGVFGYIRHATVKNVTLDSTCRVSSSCDYPGYYRGGMVGFSDSLSVVDNIYIHSRGISHSYGSSLVGMNRNSTVRNCACGGRDYYFGSPEAGAALVAYNRSEGGYADAVVENCYFYGRIGGSYSTWYIAGLVCFNETVTNDNGKQAILKNCHSTPTHDFMGFRAYGTFAAVMSAESSIEYCYYDPTKMYQYAQMVGLNEGGELYYCSEYINMDEVGTLAQPVTVNDTTTDNLLDALNLWIANQEHPELYRTWVIMNDSIPVFGDYYLDVPEHEASYDAVTIHPNPTNGFVCIEGITADEVQVYNTMGQRVKTVQNTNEIDMGDLPQGLYYLQIRAKDGHQHVGKVTVSK